MKLSNMLNSAMVFAAKSDIRYYLNGVNVYHKNGVIEAIASTDGYCAQIIMNNLSEHDFVSKHDKYESFILSIADCKRLVAIYPLDDFDGLSVQSILDHAKPIEGNYPNITKIISSKSAETEAFEIGIDYKYLAKISQSMVKLTRGFKLRYTGAKFSFTAPNEAIKVVVSQPVLKGVSALIIIMPMKL